MKPLSNETPEYLANMSKVRAALAKSPKSMPQLRDLTKANDQSVRAMLRGLEKRGATIRVCDWQYKPGKGYGWVAFYSTSPGDNMPKPTARPPAAKKETRSQKRIAKVHRALKRGKQLDSKQIAKLLNDTVIVARKVIRNLRESGVNVHAVGHAPKPVLYSLTPPPPPKADDDDIEEQIAADARERARKIVPRRDPMLFMLFGG